MKCPVCRSSDLREATEYNKALCHIQYLIDGSLFCFDCQCEEVKTLLNNPIKNCDECSGTTMCPNSKAARNAVRKNKKPSERRWEYGHRYERGSDGKKTGRTESFRTDQNTGETQSEFHTRFEPS